ncbi:MAG: DUF3999 family protein [Cyclobacteriaceae bacterium]|nr:DUF3999 family protein [Cyclobacteriaceae bacterium]
MNRMIKLLLLLTLSTTCFAQFTYERKISDVTHPGWYQLTLPGAMFSKIRPDLADIRIYASNDTTEIPYLLKIAEDEVTQTSIALEPFNQSRKDNAFYFTVKLNRTEPVNTATLEFEQENYDSEIVVEGSNNQQEWFKLHSSRIISISNPPVSYRYNHVHFPNTEFTFLRFTIVKGTTLKLNSVKFYQIKTIRGIFTEAANTLRSNTIGKRSEFYLTFNQPVLLSRLSIEPAPAQQFYRSIQIDWLADSITSEKGVHYNYQTLYTGVISSFQQDTIQFTPQVVHKVRITIYNQDNPPIQVTKVTGWTPQVTLVTRLQPGAYSLKYGTANVFHPNYDIDHFIKDIPDTVPELQLSSELKSQQNTVDEPNPWFKNKIWMWAAIGIIVAILGFFTMRMMREQ